MKRINSDSKLIPIVLDNLDVKTEVPAPLRHLLLEFVTDPRERVITIARVLRTLYRDVDQPPLGPPPIFVGTMAVKIPGLDRIDSLTLKTIGTHAIESGSLRMDTADFVDTATTDLGITRDEALESLQVLEAEHYLDVHRTIAEGLAGMRTFQVSTYGLDIYLRAYDARFPNQEQTVLARIVEQTADQGTEAELVTATGLPPIVVRHVLDVLSANGDLKLSKPRGGTQGWRFHSVSPRLRRRAAR